MQLAEGIPDFRCGEIPSYTQFGSLDGSFSELEAVAMHPALTILVTDKLDVISLCPQSAYSSQSKNGIERSTSIQALVTSAMRS